MAQVQCPNCKMYKTVLRRSHITGLGAGSGSCLIWIFPPLGLLIVIISLIVSLLQTVAKDNRVLCLNCKYVFNPEPDKTKKKVEAHEKPIKHEVGYEINQNKDVKALLSWIFGVFLLFDGFMALLSGNEMEIAGGFFVFLCGLWLLPPIANKLDSLIKIPLWIKVFIIFSLVIVGGAISSTKNLPTDADTQETSLQN